MEQTKDYQDELRKIQLCELELIHLFVDICEKEHLMYYMVGGTMLGAIRHKGYIPWDDDADFSMPRPDYETFIRVAGKYMPEGMKISMIGDAEWEKGDKPYQLRLINMQAEVKRNGSQNSFMTNAWIDIFQWVVCQSASSQSHLSYNTGSGRSMAVLSCPLSTAL